MNKTEQEYYDELIAAKESMPELASLDAASKTSIWRLFLNVFSSSLFLFQSALRMHLADIEEKLADQKVPSLRWYRQQALRFQFGFALLPESDQFDNTNATLESIADSQIVKYAAVTRHEQDNGVKILMKIAGARVDEVLTEPEVLAFKSYIQEVQAAGDHIVVVNYKPDKLKVTFNVCYDPMVLLDNGMSIQDGNFPVQEAIKQYLTRLPFNGELSVQQLEAAVLAVEGVVDLQNVEVASKWIVPGSGYGFYQPITISEVPKSGRFSMTDDEGNDDFSGIAYLNYTPNE